MSHTSTVCTFRAMDLATYIVQTFIFIVCRVARDLYPAQNNDGAFLQQFFTHYTLF
jgi:hypothetical protein